MLKNKYGNIELPFAEEVALWKKEPNRAMTRMNKVHLYNDLKTIVAKASERLEYVTRIPEENSKDHAELVKKLEQAIHAVRIALDESYKIGQK